MKNTSQHFLQSDAAVEQTGKQRRQRERLRLPTTEPGCFCFCRQTSEKNSVSSTKRQNFRLGRGRLGATSTTAKRETGANFLRVLATVRAAAERDRRFFFVIIFDFLSDASAGEDYLSAARQILTFFRRFFVLIRIKRPNVAERKTETASTFSLVYGAKKRNANDVGDGRGRLKRNFAIERAGGARRV
jgi:hypothetical protein